MQPGETLKVRIGSGHKGPHITEVLSVDSTAAPTAPRRSSFRSSTADRPVTDTAVEKTGTVKWFNTERGYGFITPNGGDTKDGVAEIVDSKSAANGATVKLLYFAPVAEDAPA